MQNGNYNKMTRVLFTRDKGFWYIHPMEYIDEVSLILHPGFMIPRIGEYITLFYKNSYVPFRVTSVLYDSNVGQIEITVK